MTESTIANQISTLLILRKKLKDEEYLTSREEQDLSMILGIQKLKDPREMAAKIDEFFTWVMTCLRENSKYFSIYPEQDNEEPDLFTYG